ncbi:Conserved_hypothetical protein [Hexamita inflata]|uniref:Vacuolar protein sorting-associated protein 11 homolog n=1 Tax=Hexamita inflata TaxID=28002 RepID=A0AA86TQ56_9EUKA|nr:Conserved hypothetical protein [Hexamita inflata]
MNVKPQVVTSYRREAVSQAPDTCLSVLIDENQSVLTCFNISPSSQYLVGDSVGNLFIGQKVNRVMEFQSIQVYTEQIFKIFCDQTQIICLGRDKEQRELILKSVEFKNKKYVIKSTFQTTLTEDPSYCSMSFDFQTLAISDKNGLTSVFKLPKIKLLFQENLKLQDKNVPVLFNSFMYLDNENTLRPNSELKQSQIRALFVCGSNDQTQASIILFNVSTGEKQSINLSSIFALTSFVPTLLAQTENKIVYATQNKCKAAQQLYEQISVQDQKQFNQISDIKELNHVVKQNILNQVVPKDGNVLQLKSFKSGELLAHADTYIQIFNAKNRVLYQQNDSSSNMLISFDVLRQSYVLLNCNPDQISLIELCPIDSDQLIDSLLQAKLFEEALQLALDARSRTKPYKIASVRQAYAINLFEQQLFERACDQYVETIGVLEASVVVRAFLEYGRTQELTRYLEALHHQKIAAGSHTNLLMNCYTKNNDVNRLIQFIRSAEELFVVKKEPPVFNVVLACQNLISGNMKDLAIETALVLDNEVFGIQLMIQNDRIEEAVKVLRTLEAKKCAECIIQFGNELMGEKLVEDICSIIKDLCLVYQQSPADTLKKQQIKDTEKEKYTYIEFMTQKQTQFEKTECFCKIDQFVHLFVERKMEIHLVKILTALINTYLQDEHLRDLQISDVCVETYFELLLKQLWYAKKKFDNCDDVPFDVNITDKYIENMLQTLSNSNLKYSYDHLLILFQTYDLKSCVIHTLQKLNMKQECLKFYAQNNQFEEAINLYKQADDDQKNQLFSDLLQLAVQTKNSENVKKVLKLFENNQSISTLNIIELLVQFDPDQTLEAVYDFLKNKLIIINDQMLQSYESYTKTLKNLEQTRKQIEELKKPKLYQRAQCAKCNLAVDPPVVYVRCGHCYHERCWKSINTTCNCWAQQEQKDNKIEFEVDSYKTFADVLSGLADNPYIKKE